MGKGLVSGVMIVKSIHKNKREGRGKGGDVFMGTCESPFLIVFFLFNEMRQKCIHQLTMKAVEQVVCRAESGIRKERRNKISSKRIESEWTTNFRK